MPHIGHVGNLRGMGGLWTIFFLDHFEVEFRKQMRVGPKTFKYLCTLLSPVLKKNDTRMRDGILVEKRIVITLSRLATRNSLIMIADSYVIGVSTTSTIVRECCEAMKIHLRLLVFRKPTLFAIKMIATEIEALHGIPIVLGAN